MVEGGDCSLCCCYCDDDVFVLVYEFCINCTAFVFVSKDLTVLSWISMDALIDLLLGTRADMLHKLGHI